MRDQLPDEDRRDYLIAVCLEFIESNNLERNTVIYDDAGCDGYCLMTDLSISISNEDEYNG